MNTEVYLYWADPATYLPFTVWNDGGMFVGRISQTIGNKIVIPRIRPRRGRLRPICVGAAGTRQQHSARRSLLSHRSPQNAADPSNVGPGGWDVIAGRNNVGLHNVHVQQSPAEIGFLVRGTDDEDGLIVIGRAVGGQVELSLPVQALPWRDARVLGRHSRSPYGCAGPDDDPVAAIAATLDGDSIRSRTGVVGARALRVRNGIATIVSAADAVVTIPCLRIAPAAAMPVNLRVTRPRATLDHRDIHVGQLSGGRRVGGVTLRLEVAEKRRKQK